MGSVNSILLFVFLLSLPIQQMGEVRLRAHLQPRRYPGQRHRRLPPQPPGHGHFLPIAFAARCQRPVLPPPLLHFLRDEEFRFRFRRFP